jgi:hypothetical protein
MVFGVYFEQRAVNPSAPETARERTNNVHEFFVANCATQSGANYSILFTFNSKT